MNLPKKFYIGLFIFIIGITTLITLHYIQKRSPNTNNKIYTQTNIWFSKFDSDLLNFIWTKKWNENFIISPISFKAALTMLTVWASWDTEEKLLNIVWYETSDDYLNRAINLKKLAEESNEKLYKYNKEQEKYNDWFFLWNETNDTTNTNESNWDKQNSFMIASSVRHNSDQRWEFKNQFKEKIFKIWWSFGEVPGDQLHKQINEWVNKNTNWLIPSLIQEPIPNVDIVLVNTTYLKSAWTNSFEKYATKQWDFKTIGWNTVKKDFMHKSDKYLYYEDKDSQILTIQLQWWFAASFVLWDSSNILQKIRNSTTENVKVTLPKFELETSLDKKELLTFLNDKWLKTDLWNFSNMIENEKLIISDIIQKAKIDLNEDWLEAAATTAIMLEQALLSTKQPKYKEFTADQPFQFYIYTNDSKILEPQLLFYGQIIE